MLTHTERRWLLIFDNALHWTDIARFLPNSLRHTQGSVLITTQNENLLPSGQNVAKMQLDTLDIQAGSDMLLKYLDRDVRSDPERHLAKEISAFVGGLPVAIDRAVRLPGEKLIQEEEEDSRIRRSRAMSRSVSRDDVSRDSGFQSMQDDIGRD